VIKYAFENAQNWYYQSAGDLQMAGCFFIITVNIWKTKFYVLITSSYIQDVWFLPAFYSLLKEFLVLKH